MARKRKASDETYNARRRYRRQAERYQRKAEKASGAEAARYRTLAKSSIKKALSTYAGKSKPQGAVLRIARELGADEEALQKAPSRVSETRRRQVIAQSERALASNADLNAQARAILSTDNIGARFYGGLVEIWRGTQNREQAILDYFGASNLMEVLERVEKVIPNLYEPATEAEGVSSGAAAARLMLYVAQNR